MHSEKQKAPKLELTREQLVKLLAPGTKVSFTGCRGSKLREVVKINNPRPSLAGYDCRVIGLVVTRNKKTGEFRHTGYASENNLTKLNYIYLDNQWHKVKLVP